MASYIDLDSYHRNTSFYPNSSSYTVTAEQMATWPRAPRQVTAHTARPGSSAVEFTDSLQCKTMILPFSAITYVDKAGVTQNTHTADLQRVYLNIRNEMYDDKQLIYSIDNNVPRAKFVLTQIGIQYDNTTAPAWVKFSCNMDQVMRFSRNSPLIVEIMQEDGFTITIPDGGLPGSPTRSLQTYILMEITPYFRDSDYDNHSIGLTQF